MLNHLGRIGIVLGLTLAVLVGCSDSSDSIVGTRMVTGNGIIEEETRPVSGIVAVVHASEGALRIEQGQAGQEALRVQADENLLQHIITEVQGGTLQIRTESNIDMVPSQTIEFHLTVVDLESVLLSGVGGVEADSLTVDALSLSKTGVGGMEFTNLDATTLTVENSGLGGVLCSGRIDEQAITIDGIGGYEAPSLLSREATVSVTGLTSATVNVSERLTATVGAQGSVIYIDSSGGGLIVDCTPATGCSAQ